MEKEQNLNQKNKATKPSNKDNEVQKHSGIKEEKVEENKELSPEDKIKELEDKLARTFAEMENQRRRFEKEKNDAFDYGGFLFAKEALNLIDNLETVSYTHLTLPTILLV